jgi:outer membrane protein, adhesin transport system
MLQKMLKTTLKQPSMPRLSTRWLAAALLVSVHSYSLANPVGVADLTQFTLGHHPSLRGAAAKNDAAQQSVEAAKWQFWPTPSLGFESVQDGRSQAVQGDKTVGVFKLQQPIWTGGRLTSGLQKAETSALVAQADTLELRQALASRVVQAWSEAVVALRKLDAQRQSLERHQRLLQMVERRLAEGASAQSDAALARSRIELLQADIQLIEAQRDSAFDRLRLLTGKSLNAKDLAWAHEPQPVVRLTLLELVDRAKSMSPQIQKSLHTTAMARADVALAKSSLMPEVSLRYEHQTGSLSVPNAPSSNRVFLSVNSALGAGLSAMSGVNAAVAQLNAAQEQIAEQEQNISEQVQLDFTLLQAAQARIRGLSMASQAAAEVLDSYERQFLAGRKQWLDLMNAAREQAQTESQLADALGAFELSSLRLVLWTGGVDALLQVRSAASNGRQAVVR